MPSALESSRRRPEAAGQASGGEELRARAYALGERIDLQGLSGDRSAAGSVVVPVGSGSAAVYRFGCVVLFNLTDAEVSEFLAGLEQRVGAGFEQRVVERAEFGVALDAVTRISERGITLGDQSPDTLQVVGDVLAKSVALEHYERHIATAFDQLEPLTGTLARTGNTGRRAKVLVKLIASGLLTEHRLIGRIEVVEKPDLLWERPTLERVHAWLVQEYEIKERQVALERKLNLLSRTAQVLLDLLQSRRSLRVEWYIVVLIVLEVVLMLAFEWR